MPAQEMKRSRRAAMAAVSAAAAGSESFRPETLTDLGMPGRETEDGASMAGGSAGTGSAALGWARGAGSWRSSSSIFSSLLGAG
jgi:hypothetical protein